MFTALAARITARPKRTLALSLLFVVVAAAFGGPVVGSLEDSGGFAADDAGSVRALQRIESATGTQATPGVVALVRTPSGAGSSAAKRRIASVQRALAADPAIASVTSVQSTRDERFVSRDGSSTYLAATLKSGIDEDLAVERLDATFERQPDVVLGGSLFAQSQIGESVVADLGRAETLAFPILFLLPLLFFRGRAAVLPLVVGVTTSFGTFLVLAGVNQVYGLSIFALNLVIGLGLGLAIDYTLLFLTRVHRRIGLTPG